ncbi:hypothetical protein IFM89_030850 [Coptis chinensis]|uniref:Uncharacterized protein n=1 Tax=Coptis chinensis TaxID=261450 RepID=A0A835H1L4_9MAGN|nr:hypothetical protein IFM89_030850 [Coptis chinensis]
MNALGGSKLRQYFDSDIGYDFLEDDTPDILKDTHTPIKAVKASFPNQKRVSPPNTRSLAQSKVVVATVEWRACEGLACSLGCSGMWLSTQNSFIFIKFESCAREKNN